MGYPPVARMPGRYPAHPFAWSRAPDTPRIAGRGVGDPRFRPVRPHVAQRAMAPRWRPVAPAMPQPVYQAPSWPGQAPAWARLQPMQPPMPAFGAPYPPLYGAVPVNRPVPWGYGRHAASLPRWHGAPGQAARHAQPPRVAAPQRLPGWLSTERFGANLPGCLSCAGG
jgi:hypothetical protein